MQILQGDWIEQLRTLPDESVQMCCTSPPYWGLRDYGTASWEGGDPECDHKVGRFTTAVSDKQKSNGGSGESQARDVCPKCGAKRIDRQLGLEKTPEEYVAKMVKGFREVRRVLRNDGTLWLNLGDSYSSGGRSTQVAPTLRTLDKDSASGKHANLNGLCVRPGSPENCKPKDLIGIPWAIAKAMRDPYYAGRMKVERDRVWMAATLDAEGSICGFKHTRQDDGRTRTGIHITITNSSLAMLDEAYRIWNVSRAEHNHHGLGHLGRLDTYRWIVHGTENKLLFLREVYPLLIVKRKQALLAYNLLLLSRDAKRLGKTSQKDSVNAKRSVLAGLISKLNHAVPVDIPDWCIEPPSVFENGWYLRSDVIWAKANCMPESVTDRPTRSHEYIFLLTKNRHYFYDHEAIKEPCIYDVNGDGTAARKARQKEDNKSFPTAERAGIRPGGYKNSVNFDGKNKGRDKQRGHSRRHDGFNDRWDQMEKVEQCSGMRNKRDVWTIAPANFPEAHFATYPPDLIKPCILAGSKPGDTILDPFGGSGTTGMVAIELGRKAILIELNPDYIKLIEQRTNVTPGLAL